VIPAQRTIRAVASALDILPTLARLVSALLPEASLDGVDISPILTGEVETVRRPPLLYFDGWDLQCARAGPWKLHVTRKSSPAWGPEPACGRFNLPLFQPELYNVDADPGEDYELSQDHPEQVQDLRSKMEDAVQTFPAEVQNAWYQTMARKVEPTPVGALPVAQPA
jgi:arylsulfatase A-like enzyme